jgi:hypothetical protein
MLPMGFFRSNMKRECVIRGAPALRGDSCQADLIADRDAGAAASVL